MVSCQEALDTGQGGLQTALQRQGTRAKVLPMAADAVADERIALDVAAPSARRDGIAAWQWRYPGSPCALAMT